MWEAEIGKYAVDLRQQGNEFAHHISTELGDGGFTSARGSDGNSPVELAPPLSGVVVSTLLIHPAGERCVACVVRGDGGTPSPDQVEPWRGAAERAVALLGQRNQVYTWQAMIGTTHSAGMDLLGQLAGARNIGPLVVEPGDVCMREYLGHCDRVDQGQFIRYSLPVIASGKINTYTWRAAEATAEWSLRRACALFSLATGFLWIPRSTPRARADDGPALTVPATVGLSLADVQDDAWTGQVPDDTPAFELGNWMDQAWDLLDEDEELDIAVDAHYQALQLKADGHPSLAYLTFVAAIEGFGMRLVPDAPCTCHPQCTHPKGIAAKRFREALKTVMTNSQIKRRTSGAYDLRSYTGHRGTLFGSERTFGHDDFRLAGLPITLVFEIALLAEIREASRRILLKALGAPEPAPAGSL